jgi:hypothetical protein
MHANEDECIKAGLDYEEVKRIAKGLSRYAKQAEKLGLTIFGGSSGRLEFDDNGNGYNSLVIAILDGRYDGGCGGTHVDDEGLERTE